MKGRKTLRDTVQEILKQHLTPAAAATPFAALIAADDKIRGLVALYVLTAMVPKEPHSRRRHGLHRRSPGMPSAEQRSANRRVEQQFAHEIFARKLRGGKRLGDVHVHELRAIAKSAADTAIRFVARGYEDAVDLFACTALANHCVAADPFALVRDTIKPSVVAEIYVEAQRAAAQAIASSSERLTQDLIDAADDRTVETKPPVRRGRPPAALGARPAVTS